MLCFVIGWYALNTLIFFMVTAMALEQSDDFPSVCEVTIKHMGECIACIHYALQWRHNGPDGVSNHLPHSCLPNCSFRHSSKKTSKLCVTGLCAGNSPVTDEFPAQMASNAEYVSVWWRHHGDDYITTTKQHKNMCKSYCVHFMWHDDLKMRPTSKFSTHEIVSV